MYPDISCCLVPEPCPSLGHWSPLERCVIEPRWGNSHCCSSQDAGMLPGLHSGRLYLTCSVPSQPIYSCPEGTVCARGSRAVTVLTSGHRCGEARVLRHCWDSSPCQPSTAGASAGLSLGPKMPVEMGDCGEWGKSLKTERLSRNRRPTGSKQSIAPNSGF